MRGINVSALVFAAAAFCLSPGVYAGLQWDTQVLELHARGGDTQAIGHFKFKNTGPDAVNIITVAASCSCTVAASDKKTVQPGEGGEIVATFNIGRSEGLSQKLVTVITDDPRQPDSFLHLNVSIPPVLKLDPPYLVWAVGEELKPKTVHISAGSDYPVHNVTVTSSNPNIDATLENLPQKGEYQLTIVPNDTGARIIALVKVKADYPTDRPRAYFVTVHVR